MKIRFLIFTSLALLLTNCGISNHLDENQNTSSQITTQIKAFNADHAVIKGTITDIKTGESIPLANVLLQNETDLLYKIQSDNEGNFSFKDLPTGNYYLTVKANSYDEIETIIPAEVMKSYSLDVKLLQIIIQLEKPVIYLYPTQLQEIQVKLNYKGELTHSYPKYTPAGWKVTAKPDGTLIDSIGQEYYALFWEGTPERKLIAKDGFIVSGNETATFLEEKLAFLGLNRREANEFIMYWLPRMENNPYNLIHFSGTEYEKLAELEISPTPETLIRVMMLTQPLQEKIGFPMQDLAPLKKERKGYTVVEWGGTIIDVTNIHSPF